MRPARLSAVVLTALVAACAPSTFDGLSGGQEKKPNVVPHNTDDLNKPDESLRDKDPRPIAPFAASWVNTARPKFTWALQDGTAGATVEIARDREFKVGAQRFTATGTEFTVDQDLEPGIWFWHLQARSTSSAGVSFGPTWSVLVRGAPLHPRADGKDNKAPHGGMTDIDGNGIPDLTISLTSRGPSDDSGTTLVDSHLTGTLLGIGEIGKLAAFDPLNPDHNLLDFTGSDAPAVTAGMDFDGDGYGEVVIADIFPAHPPDAPADPGGGEMWTYWGGPPGWGNGPTTQSVNDDGGFLVQPFTKVPALTSGDFNGDGFGDLAAIFPDIAMTVQGNKLGAFTFLPFDAVIATAPATAIVASGDFDGDGLSDLAYTPFDAVTPLRLANGSVAKYVAKPNLTVGGDITLPTRATALATGDFDGDGYDEVAFATTIGGKAAVCVNTIGDSTLNAHACWISDEPVAGFGASLGAGDVDADGVDEIFVGTSKGVTILTHAGIGFADATSVFTAKVMAADYTSHFAVFYPGGRGSVGKAQWAAYGADGHTLYVIEGAGENGPSQKYDFSLMKQSTNLQSDFQHFGATIR